MTTTTPKDLAAGWTHDATRSDSQYTVWTNPDHYGFAISASTSAAQPGYYLHQDGAFVGRYATVAQAIKVIKTGKDY